MAAGLAVFLYTALVAYLVAIGLFSDPDSVEFKVETSELQRRGEVFHLEFKLINSGTKSVADVRVGAKTKAEVT